MNTVHLGLNALDPTSWTVHEVEDFAKFLLETFGGRFPETGKIFHEVMAIDHDVTPDPGKPESVTALFERTGTFYVVVYPAGGGQASAGAGVATGAAASAFGTAGASLIVFSAAYIVAGTVDWLLHRNDKKDIPARFTPIHGSPNNVLSDRKNTARVLGRIPDIFGDQRAFPDLLALPYIVYRDHRETELAYMCVGRGSHIVTDVRDGDMLVGQIAGMSTAIFGPGQSPGGGTPDVQIGDPIPDPVYIVKKADGINGQVLQPPNAFTFIGDIPSTDFVGNSRWEFTTFKNDGAGFGLIHVGGTSDEVLEKVKVGQQLEILYDPEHVFSGTLPQFSPNELSINGKDKFMVLHQDGTGAIPNLSCGLGNDPVTIVALFPDQFYNIRVQIPPAHQAEWDLIDTFTGALAFPNLIGNGGCLITAIDAEWIGPVFVEQSVAPPREQVILCNFVAQQGLYADDGKTIKSINIRMEIEVTPADNNGVPTGDPIQLETIGVLGTFSSRTTRAVTIKIVPVTPGNFLVRARRLTRTPWKQDSPTHYRCLTNRSTGFVVSPGVNLVPAQNLTGPRIPGNGGNRGNTDPNEGDPLFKNSSYLPFKGNIQDEILWTHCFALATTEFISFGDLTTIQTRTIDSRGATQNKDRKLSCFARRLIPTWDGVTFAGPLVQNNMAENVLFTVLTDSKIGNLDPSLIDFPGIAAAFASVRAVMGGPTSDGFGGDEAGQFNYTFDDENLTLEETINIICNACFCTPYRDGDVLKVRPEIPTTAAEMVINHRNRVQGSETRNTAFGTEAEFNGVELDYVETDINNPTNYAIKTYTIPPNGVASRPKKLQIPGIRTKKMAAWQAWRSYNKILYSNEVAEVEVCHEAMMLTQMARVIMSDSSSTQIDDGEVLEASGANITTSQPTSVVGVAQYTIALQHTDGSVETLPVSAGFDARHLILGAVPALPLVTNDELGVRTLYTISKNDFTPPTAFYVQEKSCTGRQTYSLTCTNYSHAFYLNDGLLFWLPFIVQSGLSVARDWGPYELLTTSSGGSVTDSQRGTVYSGTAVNQDIDITTANVFASVDYTKVGWVKKTTASTNFPIISAKQSQDEFFEIGPSQDLAAGHNNIAYINVATGAALNEWHHYAVTYDSATLRLVAYMDGEVLGISSPVPARPIGNLRICGQIDGVNGAIGRGDDIRYYMRVLAPEEIRELFHKTRIF